MNRMANNLFTMKENGEKILITYFPLCDPALGDPVAAAKTYFKSGANVLEMGLPYENPEMDGKTVSDSMFRALEKHDVLDAFDDIKKVRQTFPERNLQVMTYFEIIDKMGVDKFAERCADAGADAVLTPNIPSNRVAELDDALNKRGLIQLRFSPYELNDAVIQDLKDHAAGYIFQQAVNGGTGKQPKVSSQAGKNAGILRKNGVTTPICGGFGISNCDQAHDMKEFGLDGIICGSAVIDSILNGSLGEFIQSLRDGLDY